jgi:hypothetical protein
MGGQLPHEYRPAVVPVPAGHFRSVELSFQCKVIKPSGETAQEGILTPPDVAFLKELLH